MATAIGIIHEENGVFGVSFPDFPGCVTGANTLEEAISKADEVLTFHVAGMVEDGDALPTLRSVGEVRRDLDVREAIGEGALLIAARFELPRKAVRINISMDESLIEQIDRAASRFGQSRSAFLADAARDRIKTAA